MATAAYWDASAILSVIVEDLHSTVARRRVAVKGHHLISSLAFAEACAVLARLAHEKHLSLRERRLAISSLHARPWSALHLEPDRRLAADLAARYPLRGADLWHLAAAATLASELPELVVVTFDRSLAAAAHDEGLAIVTSAT